MAVGIYLLLNYIAPLTEVSVNHMNGIDEISAKDEGGISGQDKEPYEVNDVEKQI